MQPPTMVEWLAGKDILITGATGFMGKVLVEKLLRCCPGISRLYLVVRTKRGCDANERMKDYVECPLFGPLLEKYPDAFDKVTCIPGDMSELECGLSIGNQEMLKEKISIVFHTAASVRFDDSLSFALKLNTRGTHELVELAKGMKKLEYVSTSYCNANLNETIEEKVYPSHLDWKVLVNLLDKDEETLDLLVYKLMWTQPNTYTLTKSLAENVVFEANGEIPVVIVRPTVVVPVFEEPVPGWTDNLNGVLGVTAGVSKGVLRTFKCSPTAALDYLPVDIAINGMLAAAWCTRFSESTDMQVYNQTNTDGMPVTFEDILKFGVEVASTYPMDNHIWFPFLILTNNTYYYHFLFFFLQLIPALVLDLLLKVMGKKTILLNLNIKIYNAAMALSNFSEKTFVFADEKYRSIGHKLCPGDRKTFITSESRKNIDISSFMKTANGGVKKYVFHEKEEDLGRMLRNHKRLYYIDRAVKVIFVVYVAIKLSSWGFSLLDDRWNYGAMEL